MSRKKRRDQVDDYQPKARKNDDPWAAPEIRKQIESHLSRYDSANVDGWKNELTGIGDFLRDKTKGGVSGNLEFVVSYLTRQECESRWRGSDLGARIVETIPDEMTREGWEISIQPSAGDEKNDTFAPLIPEPKTSPKPLPPTDDDGVAMVEELDGKLEELQAADLFREASCYERAYGGGGILLGVNDGHPMDKPLDEERIKSLDHITAFTGGWDGEIVAYSYYADPSKPNYGKPELYMLRNLGVPATTGNLITWVHESRLLVFSGTAVSREARTQMRGWGDPVFTRVEEVLSQYGQTWGGIANLMTDFSQGMLKIKDLAQSMMANNRSATKNLTNRALALNMARSISRILLIDSEEEFSRDTVSLAGIADVLQQFALRLAAAADMPVDLLMGQTQAGGLNKGDTTIRFFYDRIAARQKTKIAPHLKKLIRLILKSKDGPTGGKELEKWNVKFKSLYQLSELEKADLRKKQAETDKIYIDSGVVTPEEIAASRFGGSEYSTETVIDLEGREKMAEHEAEAREEQTAAKEEAAKRQAEMHEATIAEMAAKAAPKSER